MDDLAVAQTLHFATTVSKPAVGPNQPSIQFPKVERLVRVVKHSPLSSDEVKNAWSFASTLTRLHNLKILALFVLVLQMYQILGPLLWDTRSLHPYSIRRQDHLVQGSISIVLRGLDIVVSKET